MSILHVGDVNLYYEVHGDGEPLVLIPGLGSDVTDYGRIIELLAAGCRVVAVDNRGAGRSDKPDIPYSVEMMADDVAGLMTALGLGPAFVLGHSMGGRIALTLALRHPELVRGLVLVSTAARVSGTARGRVQLLGSFSRRMPILRSWDAYPQPYYAFLRQFEASRGFDCTRRLPEIRVPALLVHGTRDRIVPLGLAEELRAGIPGSRLVTFRGGHLLLYMQAAACVGAIREFLSAAGERPSGNTGPRSPG